MFVAICHFSLDPSVDSRLLKRIKDKVFARFKLILNEVGEEEPILAGALVSKDEDYLRSLFSKVLAYVEESEGLRLFEEKLEVIEK